MLKQNYLFISNGNRTEWSPIAKISVMSQALLRNIYGWQKVIKTKEMTENLCTSNDSRFTYMLDFMLKPGGKLEYQDNA